MSSCYICGNEIENLVIDSRDSKVCPCTKCLAIVQRTVEQLERRAMAKEARMHLWHNEITGEYSLDSLSEEDIEMLDDENVDELLDGFHLDREQLEESYE